MKYSYLLIVTFFVLLGCKQGERAMDSPSKQVVKVDYDSFGVQIDDSGARNIGSMYGEYRKMKESDTIATKILAKVTDVCKAKGCWMKLELGPGEEVMVKFKDYGFFMPKDITGREVIVNGLAYVEEMSVEDQRHFAEDGGKSKEEIAQITVPKKTYTFIADGVLLKK